MLSFKVIFPIFVYLSLGYFMRSVNLFDGHTAKKMNATIFKVFLPVLLYYNIYKTDIGTAFNPKLCIYGVSSIILIYIILFITVPLIEKDNKKRSVIIQGIFRSNFVIFGLPVVSALYDNTSTGVTAVLIAVITPIFNGLAVVVMEVFGGGKINVKSILKGIVTNPLIVASALGVLSVLFGFKMNQTVEKCVSDLSKVATPLALVLLGANFRFSSIKNYKKQIAIGLIGKLVVVPCIFLTIAALLGFRGIELASLIALFASPAAVSSYIMAEEMDGDGTLAGQYIVLGSIFSIFTVFIFVYVLKISPHIMKL